MTDAFMLLIWIGGFGLTLLTVSFGYYVCEAMYKITKGAR